MNLPIGSTEQSDTFHARIRPSGKNDRGTEVGGPSQSSIMPKHSIIVLLKTKTVQDVVEHGLRIGLVSSSTTVTQTICSTKRGRRKQEAHLHLTTF